MTMIGRSIATIRAALRSWFSPTVEPCSVETHSVEPYSVETPYGREWFPSGGRTELLANGGERRVYNTHDIIELDANGEVYTVITHDGLVWRRDE